MIIRKRSLSGGWFPETEQGILRLFELWNASEKEQPPMNAVSVIIPHAGWHFSGRIAFKALKRLNRNFDTLVIIGGHLAPGHDIVCYPEDGFDTPSGILPVDTDLTEKIRERVSCTTDRSSDNSVEALVPMVSAMYPGCKVSVFRLPPSGAALEFTERLRETAADLGRKILIAGSTDLTHYGPAYNFTPHGTGRDAADWVTRKNDGIIIEKCRNMDAAGILSHSWSSRSACSGGAAAAAALHARLSGSTGGELVEYSTSLENHVSDSFVGYAGIVFPLPVK